MNRCYISHKANIVILQLVWNLKSQLSREQDISGAHMSRCQKGCNAEVWVLPLLYDFFLFP